MYKELSCSHVPCDTLPSDNSVKHERCSTLTLEEQTELAPLHQSLQVAEQDHILFCPLNLNMNTSQYQTSATSVASGVTKKKIAGLGKISR
jgi:hypothetical protein